MRFVLRKEKPQWQKVIAKGNIGMKYEVKNSEKTERNALFARIFSLVTIVGSFCLGAAILMSELVYPEIEELSLCPLWYRIFLLASFVLSIVGAVGCAIFKKTDDYELITIYKKEQRRSFSLLVIGFVFMCAAFLDEESEKLDFIITLGGAVASLGFFSWLGVAIGLDRSRRKELYADLITEFSKQKPFMSIEKKAPASLTDIIELEAYLGEAIPTELLKFYKETNGDGELMLSVEESLTTTKYIRENYSETVPSVNDIFCFAKGLNGDYFCYIKDGGYYKFDVIFVFETETLRIYPVARTLLDLIGGYYSCF